MVSLADIAFLIIFFFLLTSTFVRDKIAVRLPELYRAQKTSSTIEVVVDRDARIYLDGQQIEQPEVLEARLKAMLADKATPAECEVRLRCERTLVWKDYREVCAAISRAGGVIAIMHEVKK